MKMNNNNTNIIIKIDRERENKNNTLTIQNKIQVYRDSKTISLLEIKFHLKI